MTSGAYIQDVHPNVVTLDDEQDIPEVKRNPTEGEMTIIKKALEDIQNELIREKASFKALEEEKEALESGATNGCGAGFDGVAALESELEKQKNRSSILQKEKQDLESELSKFGSYSANLESQLNEAKVEVNGAAENATNLEYQLNEAQEKVNATVAQLVTAQEELSAAQNNQIKISELEAIADEFDAEKQQLQNSINVLTLALKEKTEELDVSEQNVKEYQQEKNALSEENSRIAADLSNKDDAEKLQAMKVKFSEALENVSKLDQDLKTANAKIATLEKKNKIDYEEKFTVEEARRKALDNELLETKRLLKKEIGDSESARKATQIANKEIEKLNVAKEKKEKELKAEIESLWESTKKEAEKIDKLVEQATLKGKDVHAQRIKELESKVDAGEKDFQSMKTRCLTAERELANSKRKAKKVQSGGVSGEKILVRGEQVEVQESAVTVVSNKVAKITPAQLITFAGVFLLFLQIFFPALLQVRK